VRNCVKLVPLDNVPSHHGTEASPYGGYFDAMRETRSNVIVVRKRVNLRLVRKAAKGL
jgi:hypothetical protein